MTQISMTITGSAATLARVLAALDGEPLPMVVGTLAPVASVETDTDEEEPHIMPEVVAAAPTVAGEPSFDVTGLAWDERIHAASKTTTNDGKWRKRKGVDNAVFAAVEAELRGRHAAAPLAVVPQPMPVAVAPVSAPVVMEQPVVAAAPAFEQPVPVAVAPQPVPVPMPMQAYNPAPPTEQPMIPVPVAVAPIPAPAPVQQPVTAAPATVTFHDLMQMIGPKMASGEMTTDYLIQTVNEVNAGLNLALNSFTDMGDKPHAVSYCWQIFQRDGKV